MNEQLKNPVAVRTARGSALLIVLLLLGTVGALIAVVARSISGAGLEAAVARDEAQAEIWLRAGIELGVAAILQLGREVRMADAAVDLPDGRLVVRVTNESARIDLNAAPAPLLAGLFRATGMADAKASSLAASIVDWRGGPVTPSSGGTANESAPSMKISSGFKRWLSADGPGQTNRNRRVFLHPWQLASVPGFSKPVVAQLVPFVTIANTAATIDPDIASAQVLAGLPGASPERVDAFRDARRDGAGSRDMAIVLLGIPEPLLTANASPGWRIEIRTTPKSGRTRRGEAVIVILAGDTQPYRVLYVLDDRDLGSR
jgi:general secretion pathway protein K